MKVKEWLEHKIVEAYVRKVEERLKQRLKHGPRINPVTGEINLKYDVMPMSEDFFIPIKEQHEQITDIEYLQQNLFRALNIPKQYMK
jgi:hypothetical protein